MKNIKLAEAQTALQAIANQKGRAGYERAKAAFLDDKIIVDDESNPIADVSFEDPAFAEKAKQEYEAAKADAPDLTKQIEASVSKALAKASAEAPADSRQ